MCSRCLFVAVTFLIKTLSVKYAPILKVRALDCCFSKSFSKEESFTFYFMWQQQGTSTVSGYNTVGGGGGYNASSQQQVGKIILLFVSL